MPLSRNGTSRIAALLALLALVPAIGALAAEKKQAGDRFWIAPDLANYPVTSIALLPPATYDGNVDARKQVEAAVGAALKGSGHRWASSFIIRDVLLKAGGDSLLRAINDKLLKNPRVDSLDAAFLCRTLRTRALLTVRVDQLERRELELDQSGKPSTTAQLRAALVDSTGRLLWTVSSTETVEGAHQDANANVIGVKASGLNTTSVGNTSAAPPYHEVLAKMCRRWTEAFPARPAPPTADSSATGK
jgi:hypothetical protein